MKQFIKYVLKDNKDIHKTNYFFEDTYELQFVDKFKKKKKKRHMRIFFFFLKKEN